MLLPYVQTGKRKPTKRAEKVAALCSEWLRQIPDLDRALAHLTDAVYKGYSVCEVTWARRGRYLIGRAPPDPGAPLCLRWRAEPPRLRRRAARLPGDDLIRQYPYRFVVHQPRVNGDSPAREGLGRVLVWLSCFASWSWRDWMLFAELFGKPWRILTLDREKLQDEDEAAAGPSYRTPPRPRRSCFTRT